MLGGVGKSGNPGVLQVLYQHRSYMPFKGYVAVKYEAVLPVFFEAQGRPV